MTETRLPVIGFEGIYEVSDVGRVRRIAPGRGVRRLPYVLAPRPTTKGYTRVRLAEKDYAIHLLVLRAFVGSPPSELHQGNHRNGDKADNSLVNLEWVTPSENARHAVATGLHRALRGEANGRAKLTAGQVTEIRRAKGSALQREIAARFGVSTSLVGQIHSSRVWSEQAPN